MCDALHNDLGPLCINTTPRQDKSQICFAWNSDTFSVFFTETNKKNNHGIKKMQSLFLSKPVNFAIAFSVSGILEDFFF